MITTYSITDDARAKLEALVDRIEARPGDMIRHRELDELQERINVRAVIHTLPESLSEDDFAGILKLALLTECATDSYGDAIQERAERYNAAWLGRFNTNVWVPDELTHHTPYKVMLRSIGFSEAELDREIRETQERAFVHRGGDTPVHVTTFGIVQEYLTDNWHGLIAGLLRRAAPEAAHMATRVKRRETLHTVWYRDMTALQIEANPQLVAPVAEALLKFEMPGNSLLPELQGSVSRWMPHMGADFERIMRDMVRIMHEAMGDVHRTGQLIVALAAERGFSLGPLSPHVIKLALERLGGPGYGLIGEALLEAAGLSYLFRVEQREHQDRAFVLYGGIYERIRSLVRSWLARQIDFN